MPKYTSIPKEQETKDYTLKKYCLNFFNSLTP